MRIGRTIAVIEAAPLELAELRDDVRRGVVAESRSPETNQPGTLAPRPLEVIT